MLIIEVNIMDKTDKTTLEEMKFVEEWREVIKMSLLEKFYE